jgi:biopolymer transport protein TolR
MMQEGIDVNLPQAQGKTLPSKEKRITISITRENEIYLNERKVEFSLLEDTLKKIYQNRSDREIFLRADQTVPYGFVVKTMGAIKSAGIEQLGMITVPLETKG